MWIIIYLTDIFSQFLLLFQFSLSLGLYVLFYCVQLIVGLYLP